MTDIVERLCNRVVKADVIHATLPLDMMAVPVEEVNEAATEIETLRAENEKLRALWAPRPKAEDDRI